MSMSLESILTLVEKYLETIITRSQLCSHYSVLRTSLPTSATPTQNLGHMTPTLASDWSTQFGPCDVIGPTGDHTQLLSVPPSVTTGDTGVGVPEPMCRRPGSSQGCCCWSAVWDDQRLPCQHCHTLPFLTWQTNTQHYITRTLHGKQIHNIILHIAILFLYTIMFYACNSCVCLLRLPFRADLYSQ